LFSKKDLNSLVQASRLETNNNIFTMTLTVGDFFVVEKSALDSNMCQNNVLLKYTGCPKKRGISKCHSGRFTVHLI